MIVHLFLSGTEDYWDDPRKVGSEVTASNGGYYYQGPGAGTSTFINPQQTEEEKIPQTRRCLLPVQRGRYGSQSDTSRLDRTRISHTIIIYI